MLALLLLALPVHAASLDNLEVGGPFGTPGATGGTALWWNPAGLAAEGGTRVQIEGAPILGRVGFDRADPLGHGYGGSTTLALVGVVPFAGVASDLGVENLGVGLAVAVPYARGGAEVEEPGTARFAMREGHIMALFGMAGAAWRPIPELAVGGSLALVRSSWSARVDSETMTTLDEEIAHLGQESGYTDAGIEDPDYAATLDLEGLTDTAVTGSIGVRVMPSERVHVSLAYLHRVRVANRGEGDMVFGCPPQEDTFGRFGAEAYGLCNSTLRARGTVAYTLPWRLHGSVRFQPEDGLWLEVMGGFVAWSVYEDFEITVDGVDELNDLENPDTAGLVEQERRWARDNRDSFWAGVDSKKELGEDWLIGWRLLYDRAAVPTHALSPNNYDADTLMVTVMGGWKPVAQVQIAASFTHHFVLPRTSEDNAFHVTLDHDAASEDRWSYPQMNGTYTGRIERFGLTVRGAFGGGDRG